MSVAFVRIFAWEPRSADACFILDRFPDLVGGTSEIHRFLGAGRTRSYLKYTKAAHQRDKKKKLHQVTVEHHPTKSENLFAFHEELALYSNFVDL